MSHQPQWKKTGYERGSYHATHPEMGNRRFPVEDLLDRKSFDDAKARRDKFVKEENAK